MSMVVHKSMLEPIVPVQNRKKEIQSYDVRIKKATANLARRMSKWFKMPKANQKFTHGNKTPRDRKGKPHKHVTMGKTGMIPNGVGVSVELRKKR